MPHSPTTTLGDLVQVLDQWYPQSLAAEWDRVGLVVGDPDAPVETVLCAVDPVATVVDEAIDLGAGLIVTHHPLLLRPVHSVAATTFKGKVIHRLIAAGCGLYSAHTNADSAVDGVNDQLATTLGLAATRVLTPASTPPLDKLVTFVPVDSAESVIDALAAAGAGGLGGYDRCAWTVAGTGTFRPGAGAQPAVGRIGEITRLTEQRVEMILARRDRAAVIQALKAAHPYEEVAFDVIELADLPSASGLGRVGQLPRPMTLGEFADHVARVLPATAQGVRVAGPLSASVRTVALCSGAGDSEFDAARASGADVYVTADLRHHPASEAREHADGAPPYLVDVSHWASEWPWVPHVANQLSAYVRAVASRRCTDPWTGHVRSPQWHEGEWE